MTTAQTRETLLTLWREGRITDQEFAEQTKILNRAAVRAERS